MKSSHSIISKLKSKQEFKRLQEIDDIGKIINALPLEMRKYISFGIQKKHKLCFALNNPLLCSEYNRYKSSLILAICQEFKEHFTQLQEVKEVWFYFPQSLESKKDGAYFNAPKHFASVCEVQEEYYLQRYEEHSKGEFINLATDPKLHKLFESIRQNILKNLNA